MDKMAGFIGMIAGSSLGGWLGSQVGLMSMAMLSAVGAGAGFYYGRKIWRDFLE